MRWNFIGYYVPLYYKSQFFIDRRLFLFKKLEKCKDFKVLDNNDYEILDEIPIIDNKLIEVANE